MKKIIYCVKIIKCCQNFRKEENRKYIFLSDRYILNFQNYKFSFWNEWASSDVKAIKEGKEDEKWVIVLRNLEKIMPKLGCNKTSIYSTIAELGKNNIKDEPTFLKYMREVVQNLEIFKS